MTCYRSANHWIRPAEPAEHERRRRSYILGKHYINNLGFDDRLLEFEVWCAGSGIYGQMCCSPLIRQALSTMAHVCPPLSLTWLRRRRELQCGVCLSRGTTIYAARAGTLG